MGIYLFIKFSLVLFYFILFLFCSYDTYKPSLTPGPYHPGGGGGGGAAVAPLRFSYFNIFVVAENIHNFFFFKVLSTPRILIRVRPCTPY